MKLLALGAPVRKSVHNQNIIREKKKTRSDILRIVNVMDLNNELVKHRNCVGRKSAQRADQLWYTESDLVELVDWFVFLV